MSLKAVPEVAVWRATNSPRFCQTDALCRGVVADTQRMLPFFLGKQMTCYSVSHAW